MRRLSSRPGVLKRAEPEAAMEPVVDPLATALGMTAGTQLDSAAYVGQVLEWRRHARSALLEAGVTPELVAERIASLMAATKAVVVKQGKDIYDIEYVDDSPTRLGATRLAAELLSMTPGSVALEVRTQQASGTLAQRQKELDELFSGQREAMASGLKAIWGEASTEQVIAMDPVERTRYLAAVGANRLDPRTPRPNPLDYIEKDKGGNVTTVRVNP